jgi:hypothetical protein
MTIPTIEPRRRTGEKCAIAGRYRFDGYVDTTSYPTPHPQEMEIPLEKEDLFPPIRSTGKACFWKLKPQT